MATGTGDIKERPQHAMIEVILAHPEDFPSTLRQQYEQLVASGTRSAAVGHEGTVRATLNGMSIEEAAGLAKNLYALAIRL